MNILKRRPTMATSPEAQASARRTIGRWTGLRERDLDFGRLDDDELDDLLALTRELRTDEGDGFDGAALEAKERERWERLVAKAAGDERVFEKRREEAEARRSLAELAVRARRPAPRPPAEGCLNLDRQSLLRAVRDGFVWAEDLAVYLYVAAQLETGEALSPRATFEGAGDDMALLFRRDLGVIATPHNPEANLSGWKNSLDNLVRIGWLKVEQRGNEVAVQHGPASPRRTS
jgi:hypothetical protein